MELKWVRRINGLAGRCFPFDLFMDFIARFGHIGFVLYGIWLWTGGAGAAQIRRRRAAVTALMGVAVCSLLSMLIGKAWPRPRPFARDGRIWNFTAHKSNASFPSNHTMNSAVIAMVLVGMKMPLRFVMAGLSGLIAFSRLYAGIHYPSDLAGGAGMAFLVYKGLLERPGTARLASAAAGALTAAGIAARLGWKFALCWRHYGRR